jgi:ABC-type multidrug transport system fused ATPase/permease subunit
MAHRGCFDHARQVYNAFLDSQRSVATNDYAINHPPFVNQIGPFYHRLCLLFGGNHNVPHTCYVVQFLEAFQSSTVAFEEIQGDEQLVDYLVATSSLNGFATEFMHPLIISDVRTVVMLLPLLLLPLLLLVVVVVVLLLIHLQLVVVVIGLLLLVGVLVLLIGVLLFQCAAARENANARASRTLSLLLRI